MPITIPRYYTNRREYLSATVQNAWQTALMTYYAIATRQSAFCRCTDLHSNYYAAIDNDYTTIDDNFYNGDAQIIVWSGYFIYTESGVAIRYAFTHHAYSLNTGNYTAHSEIRINGTAYVSKTSPANTAQTYNDSFILGGLTVGEVYKLELVSWLTTTETTSGILLVDPTHFSLTHAHTYPTIPTFAAAPTGSDFTLAQLNTIADALDAFGNSVDLMPPQPTATGRASWSFDTKEYTIWAGSALHAHNKIHVTLLGGANVTNKVTYKIYYGADVVATGYLPLISGLTGATPTAELTTLSIDADISTYGHPIGNYVKINVTLTGANNFPVAVCEIQDVHTFTDTPPTLPTAWTHGDTISFTKLNWYKSIFDIIDPAATAPTAPLFFEQNAIITAKQGYWIRHTRPYLHWIIDNPTLNLSITLDGQADPLKNIDPLKSTSPAELPTIKEIITGTLYRVQNVLFAQEND